MVDQLGKSSGACMQGRVHPRVDDGGLIAIYGSAVRSCDRTEAPALSARRNAPRAGWVVGNRSLLRDDESSGCRGRRVPAVSFPYNRKTRRLPRRAHHHHDSVAVGSRVFRGPCGTLLLKLGMLSKIAERVPSCDPAARAIFLWRADLLGVASRPRRAQMGGPAR